MSYKIAIASSNGICVDLGFGSAEAFDIYEVDGIEYHFLEKRKLEVAETNQEEKSDRIPCGSENGCGSNAHGGCGTGGSMPRAQLVNDCRCVVCKKIGFQVQKQFEKFAISSFDVECTIEEALFKIVNYLYKVDGHQSLRGNR